MNTPIGRLVLILEPELHPLSRTLLRARLQGWQGSCSPTFVAAVGRPARLAAVAADDGRVFYNVRDDMELQDTLELLPWEEIWLLAAGRMWQGMAQA
jgi:hypothetical protein